MTWRSRDFGFLSLPFANFLQLHDRSRSVHLARLESDCRRILTWTPPPTTVSVSVPVATSAVQTRASAGCRCRERREQCNQQTDTKTTPCRSATCPSTCEAGAQEGSRRQVERLGSRSSAASSPSYCTLRSSCADVASAQH